MSVWWRGNKVFVKKIVKEETRIVTTRVLVKGRRATGLTLPCGRQLVLMEQPLDQPSPQHIPHRSQMSQRRAHTLQLTCGHSGHCTLPQFSSETTSRSRSTSPTLSSWSTSSASAFNLTFLNLKSKSSGRVSRNGLRIIRGKGSLG